jgi:hypothetical protein
MRSSLAPLLALFTSSFLAVASFGRPASADEPPVAPPAPPPPPSPRPPPPDAPLPLHEHGGGEVPASVEGPREGIVLARRVSSEETGGRVAFVLPIETSSDRWEPVCVTPCRVELPRWSSYRVDRANGVTGSREFTLPANRESVKLTIDPGNLLVHRIAQTVIWVGTAAAITGGALVSAEAKWQKESDPRTAGIIVGGAGLVFLAVGIPLAIATRTHVDVDGAKVAKTGPRLTARGVVF